MKRQRGVNFMCPDSGLGVEAHVKNNKKKYPAIQREPGPERSLTNCWH